MQNFFLTCFAGINRCPIFIVAVILWQLSSNADGQQIVKYEKAVLSVVHNTTIAAIAPGIIKEIHSEMGDEIKKNQIIVTLDRDEYEARYQVALEEEKIAVLQANNDVDIEFATKQAEVNKKLFDRSSDARIRYEKSVILTQLDKIKLELEQSLLALKQAALKKEIAETTMTLRGRLAKLAATELDHREIRAPLDGKIAQLMVQEGEWVNAGEPIVRIIDLRTLRVQGVFGKEHFGSIKKGAKCVFRFSIGGNVEEIPLTISYVGNEIVDDIFQVWADVECPEMNLVPGVRGCLEIVLAESSTGD